MLGKAQFALMKPTAFFINIARGELVDEAALVAVLRERRIAGAALDVFEHEPLPTDHPLIALENVILTPHWSASTRDVWAATGRAMVEGMLRAARGEIPDNVVNREVLDARHFVSNCPAFVGQAFSLTAMRHGIAEPVTMPTDLRSTNGSQSYWPVHRMAAGIAHIAVTL